MKKNISLFIFSASLAFQFIATVAASEEVSRKRSLEGGFDLIELSKTLHPLPSPNRVDGVNNFDNFPNKNIQSMIEFSFPKISKTETPRSVCPILMKLWVATTDIENRSKQITLPSNVGILDQTERYFEKRGISQCLSPKIIGCLTATLPRSIRQAAIASQGFQERLIDRGVTNASIVESLRKKDYSSADYNAINRFLLFEMLDLHRKGNLDMTAYEFCK